MNGKNTNKPTGNGGKRMRTILVVEDDQTVAELLRTVLNTVENWAAIVVFDPRSAFEVLEHVAVDMLMVDVNLPYMSGPALVATLRSDPRWSNPPVVMMSADAGQEEIRTAIRRGYVDRFIAKPFDVDVLVGVVRSALERRDLEAAHERGRSKRKRPQAAAVRAA